MAQATEVPVVRYALATPRESWELSEEKMPESVLHDEAVTLLRAILAAWAASPSVLVARNLAVRWDEAKPRLGVDPDIAVFSPPPPRSSELTSVRTWLEGHAPPVLAIEVVSESDPRKDYVVAPDKYAASGTGELWIFDPLLVGPRSHGGPFRLQVWRREGTDFARIYAGDGPAYSTTVRAHLVVFDEGRKLRLASQPDGGDLWLTLEEAERAAKDAERAAKDAERAAKDAERAAKDAERAAKDAALAATASERAAKDAALARIAALEEELRRRGG